MRPKLPPASEILPYLNAIDSQRWYSNWGPLVTRLEEQLARRLGLSNQCVVSTSNCTAGLTAALLACDVPFGAFCVVPSWTFVATPHAARAAGLLPWFHDVDPCTWSLDPDAVAETISRMAARPGAVIVVSPFGAPLNVRSWEMFQDRTAIPVIIDAAAGFDTIRPSRLPCVVSLHATKLLGAGEGGFIVTADPRLAERIRAACNFGFHGSRTALLPAMNAKMSEYHAAVALASLAAWPVARAQHERIMQWYRDALAPLQIATLQPGYGEGWVSGTTNVLLPAHFAASISRQLESSGIETRAWWGLGCHVQPAFRDCPRQPLPVTVDLGGRVLGFPHFPDMRQQDVIRVVEALSAALGANALANLAESLCASRLCGPEERVVVS